MAGAGKTLADLKASLGPQALITRAVGDRLDQAFELSFWLLGLLHDARSMRRAHAHLAGGDRGRKAWAIELVYPWLFFLDAYNALRAGREAGIAQYLQKHRRETQNGGSTNDNQS